jgi:phosphoheptose isomerase
MIKIKNFFKNYLTDLNDNLNQIDFFALEKAFKLIEKTIKNKKSIFVCGNGGSAAISNHLICDYLKLIRTFTNFKPKVFSLSSNLELITAISNDKKYEDIFSYQIESLGQKTDLLIAISSSGNSKNIINAIKSAKKMKIKILSLCGFDGGYLKKNSDCSIHVKIKNYGRSEDSHHIIMHILMHYFVSKYNSSKKLKL